MRVNRECFLTCVIPAFLRRQLIIFFLPVLIVIVCIEELNISCCGLCYRITPEGGVEVLACCNNNTVACPAACLAEASFSLNGRTVGIDHIPIVDADLGLEQRAALVYNSSVGKINVVGGIRIGIAVVYVFVLVTVIYPAAGGVSVAGALFVIIIGFINSVINDRSVLRPETLVVSDCAKRHMAVGEEVIVIGNPCTLTDNELSVFADANACAVGGYRQVIITNNAAENTACCMRNFLSCKLKVIGKSVIKTGNIGLGTLLNTLLSAAVGLVAGLFPIIKNIERKVSACAGKSRGLTVGIGYCSLAFGKVFVTHNVDCRLCVRLSGLGEIVGGNQSILYVDGTVIIYTAALNFNKAITIRAFHNLSSAGIVNDLREALHHFDIGRGRIGVGALYVADSASVDIYARAV